MVVKMRIFGSSEHSGVRAATTLYQAHLIQIHLEVRMAPVLSWKKIGLYALNCENAKLVVMHDRCGEVNNSGYWDLIAQAF